MKVDKISEKEVKKKFATKMCAHIGNLKGKRHEL